jgi:hypothetical protein
VSTRPTGSARFAEQVVHQLPVVHAALPPTAAAVGLVACSTSSEGTVMAKTDQGAYDYACQVGGSVTGPVAVPVWGSCSGSRCWRLIVRDSDGDTAQACVSSAEYDRIRPGAFWHGRTDQ